MKRIIHSITVILALVLCLTCCKNSAKSIYKSPESVAEYFLTCMQKQKYDKAADCCYYDCKPEELEGRHNAVQLYCEIAGSNLEKNGGIKSFKVDEVTTEGDKAIVTTTIKFGNDVTKQRKTKTKKVNGKWYLDM